MRPASRMSRFWLLLGALALWVVALAGPAPVTPVQAAPQAQSTRTATPTPTPIPLPSMAGDPISCPDGSARSWKLFAGGPQPGRFRDPHGIVIDRAGTLVVADSGNGRLQRLSRQGEALGIIPIPPERPDLAAEPHGLAIDDQDNLYVADSVYLRVLKIGPDGAVLASWKPSFPAGRDDFRLEHVAVGGGYLYISAFAFGNRSLTRPSISYLERVTLATGERVLLDGASIGRVAGLAADVDGYLYASEYSQYGGVIRKVSPSGEVVAVWAKAGEHNLARLRWLTIGPDGNLYLSDYDGWWIRALTRDGEFLGSWFASQGAGLAVDRDGTIYVAGARSGDGRAISRFAPSGERLESIGTALNTPGVLEYIQDAAIDEAGNVDVLTALSPQPVLIHRYAPSGALEGARPVGALQRGDYGPYSYSLPALADDGHIYAIVATPSTETSPSSKSSVVRLTVDGEIVGRWQAVSDGRRGLSIDLSTFVVAPDGTAYMADGFSVNKVGADGQQLGRWLAEDVDRWLPRSQSRWAQALALDSQGNLYVGGGAYIYKLTPDGSVLARWGAPPPESGQQASANVYAGVGSMAVDAAGYVYMSAGGDLGMTRMLGPDGVLLAVWAHRTRGQRLMLGEFPGSGKMVIDRRGDVYAVTSREVWRLACAAP